MVEEKGQTVRMKSRISEFFAQGFLTGLSPLVPGTVGTVPGVIIWFFVRSDVLLSLVGALVLLVSLEGIRSLMNRMCDPDPGRVVVDEIVGFIVAGLGHSRTLAAAAGLFLLFRIFDILKPWPASWANSKEGVAFVVLDDVVAGLYASGAFFLLEKLFT